MSHAPRIAIVGGGLGGTVAAILLQRAGLNVSVYEQAPAIVRIGAGINLGPNAVRILQSIGVAEELLRIGIVPKERLSRDWKTGEVMYAVPVDEFPGLYGAPHLTIHRGDLQRVLTAALAPGSLFLGKRLVGVDEKGETVRLAFADGLSAEADVVVGADGLNSKVREVLLGPEPPSYTGNVAYRSIFPASLLNGLRIPDSTKWWGEDSHILVYFITHDRDEVNLVTGIPEPDWDTSDFSPKTSDKTELRAALEGYHPEVLSVVDVCPSATKWPILDRKPLPFWSRGRIVMLGDACHPMAPHMGQGAAMAFEDAVMLARCIDRIGLADPLAAIAAYENQRRARTARVQEESHNNEWLKHGMDHGWVFGYNVLTEPLIGI